LSHPANRISPETDSSTVERFEDRLISDRRPIFYTP
jgi:hypothetical protein